MINSKPALFFLAALLGGAAYVPSQAQSQAAAGLSTPSFSVGGASSIIGPIDALFAKCKSFDPSRLAQYQEASDCVSLLPNERWCDSHHFGT
jgi:hypothetical protein